MHKQAMKVQRGRLITELIVHIDDDVVTNVGIYLRDRPLPIDANRGPLECTIWICGDPCDIEIICDGGGRSSRHERTQEAEEKRASRRRKSHDDGEGRGGCQAVMC